MKKLLTVMALLGTVAYSFGQGQVNFFNTSTTLITTNMVPGGPSTGSTLGAGRYVFGLFWADPGTSDASLFQLVTTGGTNIAGAGRFTGGQPSIAGQAIGNNISLLVRCWTANLGTDWNAVQLQLTPAGQTMDYWYGQSAIGTVTLGGGAQPIQNLFGTGNSLPAIQVPGFMLNFVPVPEPTSFALAGLGAAAMLIFRRRK